MKKKTKKCQKRLNKNLTFFVCKILGGSLLICNELQITGYL